MFIKSIDTAYTKVPAVFNLAEAQPCFSLLQPGTVVKTKLRDRLMTVNFSFFCLPNGRIHRFPVGGMMAKEKVHTISFVDGDLQAEFHWRDQLEIVRLP